jgi:hypothetical protein
MKFNKKFLAVAAAGALTVATAVPALALENEFHGAFTSFYDLSNFSSAGDFGFSDNKAGLAKDAPTENYFVQRIRLNYNAKASDNVKLVTQFQIDYKYWGKSSYEQDFHGGSALGSRGLNLQIRQGYLDLDYPSYVHAKIGMQTIDDAFKGIVFSSLAAGVNLSHEYTNASVGAGFFRFDDSNNKAIDGTSGGTTVGKNTRDMFSLDGKYSISKDLKVGAAYYLFGDNRPTTAGGPEVDLTVHTFGLNAEGAIGPVSINGFAMKQFDDAKGFAFNFGAKVPLAGGTARTEFLYVSGGNNTLYIPASLNAGTEGGGFYDNEMVILSRDKNATNFDSAIVYDVSNHNQGVIFGSLGYDHPCTDKITSSVNVGFAAVANNVNNVGTSNYLGTELNAESSYKLNPNVTLGVRAAYVFLGDYFKQSPSLDNPYDLKVLVKYAF